MNKHCMSVASLRVGTTLWFDQRWRGRVRMARRGGGTRARVGRGAHASGGGARDCARGGKVQAIFRFFFVCLIQAIH